MNKLMEQLRDRSQIQGREALLSADWHNRVIKFTRTFECKDKNGRQFPITIEFYIDTKPTEWGSDPIVTSPYVNRYPALGHKNHLLSDHSFCLGSGLANWDLCELLRQIEKWFGGFYIWTMTGVFPQSRNVYNY